MISAGAIASITWLFEKALLNNSVRSAADRCAVSFHADIVPDNAPQRLITLNISSYLFRVVALFGFNRDAATVAYFARLMQRGDVMLEEKALLDALEEFANMVCGEVNRGLSASFRHVGMSTPFVLENGCLGHLAILKPAQTQTIKVVINDSVIFEVIVCTCVDAATTLDFRVDRAEQETSSGELEMF